MKERSEKLLRFSDRTIGIVIGSRLVFFIWQRTRQKYKIASDTKSRRTKCRGIFLSRAATHQNPGMSFVEGFSRPTSQVPPCSTCSPRITREFAKLPFCCRKTVILAACRYLANFGNSTATCSSIWGVISRAGQPYCFTFWQRAKKSSPGPMTSKPKSAER